MIVMQIGNKEIKGDCKIPGYVDWITVESFDFGTERKIEKAAKGDGRDIETGKGDSQEFTIDKSADIATVDLMYASIKHRGSASASTPFSIDIAFIEPRAIGEQGGDKGFVKAYLKIRFGKAMLRQWRLSGQANARAKESLTFWYNQLAMQYDAPSPDGKSFQTFGPKGWDQLDGKDWKPPGW